MFETRCIYDNPEFMRRELWQDGKLIRSVTAEQIDHAIRLRPTDDMGRRVIPFTPGKLIGDRAAMVPLTRITD